MPELFLDDSSPAANCWKRLHVEHCFVEVTDFARPDQDCSGEFSVTDLCLHLCSYLTLYRQQPAAAVCDVTVTGSLQQAVHCVIAAS